MKTMILFFFGMLLICNACGDVDEEPPRTDSPAIRDTSGEAIDGRGA